MRKPSPRMFPNSVVVRSITWGTVKSARFEQSATETIRRADMQTMSVERRAVHGLDGSAIALTAYFPSDPGVKVSDQIIWEGTRYHVLGPAYTSTGRGMIYLVDCKAVR